MSGPGVKDQWYDFFLHCFCVGGTLAVLLFVLLGFGAGLDSASKDCDIRQSRQLFNPDQKNNTLTFEELLMDKRIVKNLIALLTGPKRVNLTGDEVPMFAEAVVALQKIADSPSPEAPTPPEGSPVDPPTK